ncbi:MAG TPA: hypothetical protein VEF76_07090 [Patescibacteria group bacterium]|nr:hypothetical protein [Patescibacteria group bacterium]
MRYRIFQVSPSGNYRGVHRLGPSYNELADETEAWNRAWHEYVYKYGEMIPEKNEAITLFEIFRSRDPNFELVGIEKATSEAGTGVIGYDVASNCWHSMLSWQPPISWSVIQKQSKLGPLFSLIEKYFVPKLNNVGLFSIFDVAEHFCEVIKTVERLEPGTWPDEFDAEVLAIFKLNLE